MTEHSAVAVAPARLRLLGGWQLIVDGAEVDLGHREQRLIALLGLTDLTARGQVASVLWPDSTDEHALGSLRRAVRQSRTKCPGALVAGRLTVALDPGVRVDVDDLRRAAGLTRLPMSDGVAHELLQVLRGQELLPGWFDEWIVDERALLQQLRVEALERISQHGLAKGDFVLAVDAAGVAIAIEPLRESARELSIRGHLGRDDVGSALHELHRYSALLDEELGIAPPAKIRALLEPPADAPPSQHPSRPTVPRQRVAQIEEELPEPRRPVVTLEEWLGPKPVSGVRRAGAALVGAAGLALAVAFAVATAGPDPRLPAATDPSDEAGPVSPLRDPGGSGTAAGREPTRTVRVRLVDGVAGSASFAVRAAPLPAAVRLVVRGPAGLRVVRHVVVRAADGRQVVVDGLDPGTYRWSATSGAAGQVGGEVSVRTSATLAEDVQDDGTRGGRAAAVAPVAETPSQAPAPQPTLQPTLQPTPHPTIHPTPSPTSTSSPTSRPTPSPTPTGTPTDPGTVAPTPVG